MNMISTMHARWIALLGSSAIASLAAAEPASICVNAGAEAEPMLMAVAANKVTFCFDWDTSARCYATDLTTGRTASVPLPPGDTPRVVPPASAPTLQIAGDAAEVCRAGGKCTTIAANSSVDPGLGMNAAANPAGTLLALSSQQWIETYQVAAKKRIARFTTGAKKSSCNGLAWADDTLVISELECGTPSGTAWLATRAGKKIAAVGGAKPIELGAMTRVKGALWAFNSIKGDAVVIQDVASGKVARTLAVGAAADGATSWIVGDGSHLVLVFGGKRAGDVVVIDPATDKITSHPGKRCPP